MLKEIISDLLAIISWEGVFMTKDEDLPPCVSEAREKLLRKLDVFSTILIVFVSCALGIVLFGMLNNIVHWF